MEILNDLRNLSSKKNKENLTLKLISLIIILIIGVIFGLIPYFIKSCRQNIKCLNLVNTFAGGLFLGIGLFHILPEANEKFEKYKKLEDIPLAYFLSFISYAVILFVERVAFDGHSLLNGEHHNHKTNKMKRRKSIVRIHSQTKYIESEGNLLKKKNYSNEKTSTEQSLNDKNNENLQLKENKITIQNLKEVNSNENQKEKVKLKNSPHSIKREKSKFSIKSILKAIYSSNRTEKKLDRTFEKDKSNLLIYNQKENLIIPKESINELRRTYSLPLITSKEFYSKINEEKKVLNLFTPLILLFALGFHGIFEGLAIGIGDNKKDILFLLLAVAAHKWAASLSLGISFIKAKTTKKLYIIMVMIFAFIGPFGIALGIILSQSTNDLLEGILLGISTGTFIYVACSDVLVEEFEDRNNKYIKFFLFVLGGIFCAGLSFVEKYTGTEE
jgi:zinc transporter 1/2/3